MKQDTLRIAREMVCFLKRTPKLFVASKIHIQVLQDLITTYERVKEAESELPEAKSIMLGGGTETLRTDTDFLNEHVDGYNAYRAKAIPILAKAKELNCDSKDFPKCREWLIEKEKLLAKLSRVDEGKIAKIIYKMMTDNIDVRDWDLEFIEKIVTKKPVRYKDICMNIAKAIVEFIEKEELEKQNKTLHDMCDSYESDIACYKQDRQTLKEMQAKLSRVDEGKVQEIVDAVLLTDNYIQDVSRNRIRREIAKAIVEFIKKGEK